MICIPSEPKKLETLIVRWVDLQIKKNTEDHHTADYDITTSFDIDEDDQKRPPQLVVRRGQTFTVQIIFNREFDDDQDHISFTFTTGTGTSN